MRIATETELITFQGWALRVRPAENPKRLLLLIHGWTGDENSMWVFARGLSTAYWMLAPRAPHPAESGGYSWRPLLPGTFGRPSLETLKPSAEALIRLIDSYADFIKLDASQFDIIGFSQGAALTNLIGLMYPERVRKMGVLAGFVPSGAEALTGNRPLEGRQVFVAHGTMDELVSIDRARESIALLQQAGAQITYCEDEVGHKVSANCLRALETFFNKD